MIDLTGLYDLWYNKIQPIADELNGQDFDDTDGAKDKAENRSHKAEVSRKLLEMADMLALMESLVRQEYWLGKGRGVDVQIGVFDE